MSAGKINPLLLASIIGLTACTHPKVYFSGLEALRQEVHLRRSSLPAYELAGGVWVNGQPLFINDDFDFGMAMGIPGIGPDIAAGQRKKRNEETSVLFEMLPPLPLHAPFQKSLKQYDGDKTLKGEERLYGILFRNPETHLKVILKTIGKTDGLLNRFYEKGDRSGLSAKMLPHIEEILTVLGASDLPESANLPGYRPHPLTGKLKDF